MDNVLRVIAKVNTGSCILKVSDLSYCLNRFQLSEQVKHWLTLLEQWPQQSRTFSLELDYNNIC